MKSGSIFRILNARNLGLIPPNPSTSSSRPNRKTMLCVWWDQQGVIYYELLKPDETVNAHRYHQQLHQIAPCSAVLAEKTWQADFSSMTTHHRIRQQWSKITWRHSTGKCYPIPLTHQTWHLLIITCFRWATPRWAALRFLRRHPKMA